MAVYAPRVHLDTHDVTNVPPPFAGRNLFTTDRALHDAACVFGAGWAESALTRLGAAVGSEEVLQWGEDANRYPPELRTFDRYGRRIDEVKFHPAYHALMTLAMDHRIHSIAWAENRAGGHAAHAASLCLFTEAEAGVMCPVSMTYASVPALRHQPDIAATWMPKIVNGTYDADLRPIGEKRGVTVGMAMTEKQGGSDVRANTTRAVPIDGRGGPGAAYRLSGHKWFCSAPMCDGFLTLAYTGRGQSCFLVPRIMPDGERNAIYIMRLKDKLGNKSNASSEIEYRDTYAVMTGEEGRGVATIIDMVHHTRLDTMAGGLGIMRRALAEATHHVSHRRAFQKTLIDQAAMRAVIADLAVDYEASALLTMRVAKAFDGGTAEERAFARLAVAAGKYWISKRTPHFVFECLECLGGGGFVEEAPLARYYREAPLNAIWEGSGNVIALDILRTLAKEPAAKDAFFAEIRAATGVNPTFDASAAALESELTKGNPAEGRARYIAERMALLLQAALLLRHGVPYVADAFAGSRLGGEWAANYGALNAKSDIDAIVSRQVDAA